MASDAPVPPNAPPEKIYGEWYDGLTAKPRKINATMLTPESLKFRVTSGEKYEWLLNDIDRSISSLHSLPLRLQRYTNDDESLVITDSALASQIAARLEQLRASQGFSLSRETRTIIRSTIISFAVLLGLWFLWPYAADALAPHMPLTARAWFKNMAMEEYVDKERVCSDPDGLAALDALKTRLTAAHPELQDVQIDVIDSPVVNAFTLPGRVILLHRGVIRQARSADEVAGILAHEMGHALHDDNVRAVLRRLPTLLVLASLGSTVNGASQLADFFIDSAHSRAFESAADATGVQLLHDANISPKGFAAFFNREKNEKGIEQALKYFATHPPSKERAEIIESAPEPANPTPALTPTQWQDLRDICHVAPPPPKQEIEEKSL